MQIVRDEKPVKVTVKFKDGSERKIEVPVEIPQPENFADAVEFFGGEAKAYAFLRNAARSEARKAAGAIFKSVDSPEQIDDATIRAQHASKNYTPTGASKTEKANALDEISALFEAGNLSEDKLRELLARAK